MTAEQFAYWLQGFMEIENPETLNENQVKLIKTHLKLVFFKVDYDNISNVRKEEILFEKPFNKYFSC